jgi:hypothetical protein
MPAGFPKGHARCDRSAPLSEKEFLTVGISRFERNTRPRKRSADIGSVLVEAFLGMRQTIASARR